MNRQQRRHPERHRPQHDPSKGVFLAWCHPGEVSGAFMDSILNLLLHDHVGQARILGHGGYIGLETGPRIASGRCELVRAFLNFPVQVDWMLMLDTDMTFEPDILDRMLEVADPEECPILGGLAFAGGRGKKMYPTIYTLSGDGAKMNKFLTYPKDQLVKVDGTGAACLLIHRSVFERMAEVYAPPYPWFAEAVIDGSEFGEDLTFCIRANRLGIPVHVHTGIKCGHVKRFEIDEEMYEAWLATQNLETTLVPAE